MQAASYSAGRRRFLTCNKMNNEINEFMNDESRLPRPRSREHLTPQEVTKFLAAAKDKSLSRNPERDFCLLLLMVRHGLRVSEAIGLRLSDVDLQAKVMHVKRLKNGVSTTHPLYNGEVKAIKDWMVKRQEMSLDALTLGAGNTLFISERRTPLERSGVCKMVNTFAEAAGLSELNVHPHMLRHSCGTIWRTAASIPAASKGILATGTSSTRSDTRSCRRPGLQICTKRETKTQNMETKTEETENLSGATYEKRARLQSEPGNQCYPPRDGLTRSSSSSSGPE